MQLPPLPEINHPKVQALFQKSDQELVTLFQRHPDAGQYFAAVFCRYGQVLYTLMSTATRSPVQSDYLFVKTWEYIYHEMRSLDLRAVTPKISLQSWLINIAAMMINRVDLPLVEDIQYSLTETPPVLWCYLNQALNQLAGNLRLVLLLSQTFKWSPARIAAYLQAEGENVSANDTRQLLNEAYQALDEALPEDIREIYLAKTLVTA
ncbi:sigma-70 family RNA polymerase sigma factor [Tumidithrix elongata RA019]|uniref:Sigma-70 family RNA polymerase sigma factor n=1 Tax=Tumidithrix elongata BACA0141 TaxID=2716417 RepID=A0AAW9Q006_9CYAN|nr:sigma-70 family RNA polymerase sigma factor [Tumidithrix elongata RA019]